MLNYAENAREAKKIIKEGKIMVDGRVIKDHKFPVGLMDVVHIPLVSEYYRMVPVKGRGLRLVSIDEEEANFKLGMVVKKMHVNGGDIQLTLHDGRNIRFKKDSEEALSYKTHDTLKITIPDQVVLERLEMREGMYGLIVQGTKQGSHGIIEKIDLGPGYPSKPTVTILTDGERVVTLRDYAMVIGDDRPWVKLA